MKVLMINGSPHAEGCTYTALKEVADVLEKEGISAEFYHIHGTVPGCAVCGHCAKGEGCVYGDVNGLLARLNEFDGIVVGSPVYYGGPAGQATAFLDRFFYAGSRCGGFAGKLGAAVVSCRRAGSTASFDRLNKYFTISGMPVVSSQYWNMVHGSEPADVAQDAEGLQTMRVLGRNMAWLLKCVEAGRKAGVPLPEREPRVYTNFIR